MKQLNITLNFAVPDDYDPKEADEIASFIIDSLWDNFYELGYKIKKYTIYENITTYKYQ